MSIAYLIFVVLTILLMVLLGASSYQTAQILQTSQPIGNPLLNSREVLLRLILCAVCVGLGVLSGVPYSELGWQTSQPWRDLALGAAIGLFLAILLYASTRWVVTHSGERYYSTVVLELTAPRSTRQLLLIALATVPAVLLEELLFRSLWIGGLGVIVPSAPLVLVGGVLFGLMHSPQGLWGMAGATGAGILMGVLFVWSGSLLLPLTAHYVANVIQFALGRRELAP